MIRPLLRTAFFHVVMVASTLFFSVLGIFGRLFGAKKGWYDWIHRTWGRTVLRAAGARIEARGLEHVSGGGGRILIANHQSFLDIWALMAALPASVRFVAKSELGRFPIFSSATRAAGHVFIDRSAPAAAGAVIRQAGQRVRSDGLALVLFPEGTRSDDGRLGRFKRGTFTLAIEMQADLVPVAIDGGGRVLGRGGKRVRPGTIHIRCSTPIPLAGMTAADRPALTERTRNEIRRLLEAIRSETDGDASETGDNGDASEAAVGTLGS